MATPRDSGGCIRSGDATRLPASQTSPALGAWNPATVCRSVDFPEPEGPRRASISPGATLRATSDSARRGAVRDGKIPQLQCIGPGDSRGISRHGQPSLERRDPLTSRRRIPSQHSPAGSRIIAVRSTERAEVRPTWPSSALFSTTTAKVSLPGPYSRTDMVTSCSAVRKHTSQATRSAGARGRRTTVRMATGSDAPLIREAASSSGGNRSRAPEIGRCANAHSLAR